MTDGIKPTPSQAENDRTAMGEHVIDHEHDGSPDPNETQQTRQVEAGKAERSSYRTRAAARSE